MLRVVVVGMVWGVFCGIANGRSVLNTLAQMAVPWIWAAALVAYRAKSAKRAAMLGAAALLVANVAYFSVGAIARAIAGLPVTGGLALLAMWTAVGLIVGPIAGLMGWWLASERAGLWAVVALATVSLAEPLALWSHINHFDAHVAYTAVGAAGVLFPLIWFRRARRKALKALALVGLLGYPVAVVLEATLIALGQISAPMRLI
jgi:hypothetical protein